MYGGRGSQYVGDFYAQTAVGGPRAISYATLKYIDNSPMFNPLADNTVMPTTTSGIIPTGLYLANVPDQSNVKQEGSGRRKKLLEMVSTEKLMKMANKYGVFPEAMERDEIISAIRNIKHEKKQRKQENHPEPQEWGVGMESSAQMPIPGNVASINTIQ